MAYRYRLFKDGTKKSRRYTLDELRDMGTFMLRDICVSEKIMTRSAGIDPKRLGREELIELLYRYRGREEESLADEFQEESVDILRRLSAMSSMAAEKLEAPYKIEVKRGVPILEAEDVLIRHGFAGDYFVGTISHPDGTILAVFEVRGGRMTLSPRRMAGDLSAGVYHDLKMLLFDAPSSLKVIRAFNDQKCSIAGERGLIAAMDRLPVLSVVEAEQSEEPLAVDFGAGYTAAAAAASVNMGADGIWGVKFQGGSRLCPSVAAVEHCRDGNVEFCFGYEALRLIRRDGYGGGMTFFHNLKLFLYEERVLSVRDCDGNAAEVSSDILLAQFFQYIISAAKGEHGRDYVKLCFQLPEKRGGLALERLRALLPGYQVEGVRSESVNCVYQEILRQEDFGEEGPLVDLAFHCGAGSSSLVACGHSTENTNVAYRVRLEEQYLNGDSGFGGNRLTCLIFMYLKIRVMLAVTGSDEEIFDERFQDAYSYVDQYGGTKEVYERFECLYEQAERVVPTRFGTLGEEGSYKRQNFYRLWFLAENLKVMFFSGSPVNMVQLPERFVELCAVNTVTQGSVEEYRLEFPVQKEALELVMAPEIYWLVKRLIEPLCNEYGILMGYRIKFTGMSCRIPVFRDALREFTVGRRARLAKGKTEGLKLRALEGAVLRSQMEKSGRVIPEITEKEAEVFYVVTAKSHDGATVRIVSGRHPGCHVYGYVMRHAATREVEFTICDVLGNQVGSRVVALDILSFEETTYHALFAAYPMFQERQGDFDSIGEEEIRLFVYREENWDFCVLPAARRHGGLGVGKPCRFFFDEDCADYFSGLF